MKKKMLSLMLLLALVGSLLVGCSAMADTEALDVGYNGGLKQEVSYDRYYDSAISPEYAVDMEVPMQTMAASNGLYTETGKLSSGESVKVSEQKLIKTVNLSTETEDMDALLNTLNGQVEALGGYVENREVVNGSAYSSYRNRWASLTLRVPVERLGELVALVEDASNVTNYTENVDDITLQYVDTASRREALETEYERLLELLEKADNMSDLLTIESRMTEVRYQLESVTSQLRVYDNKVNYATVYLSVSEVTKLTPVAERTRWQKIGDGFVESIQNVCEGFLDLCVWVLSNSPYLLIVAAMVVGIVLLARRSTKKRKEKAAQLRAGFQEQSRPPRQNPEQDGV